MTRPRIIKQNESTRKKFLPALAAKRGYTRETLLSGRHRAEKGKAE